MGRIERNRQTKKSKENSTENITLIFQFKNVQNKSLNVSDSGKKEHNQKE